MPQIPLAVIQKGRSLKEICEETQRIFTEAKAEARKKGKTGDDAVSGAIMATAYRLYLLGVQDGLEVKT